MKSLSYAFLALGILSRSSRSDDIVTKYFEGEMVQFLDQDRQIYLVLNQTLFPLANPDTMEALGLWMGEVNFISSKHMLGTPRGRMINMYDPKVDTHYFYEEVQIARSRPRQLKMPKPDLYIKGQIRSNLALLKSYVESARPGSDYSKQACANNSGYVQFDKSQYGRYGNALIELKNGIFFAEITNRTYILQDWQSQYLASFNIQYLMQKFCIIDKGEYMRNHTGAYIETIHARDAYGGYAVWRNPDYVDFKLPLFNKALLPTLESYSMEVFACLWSSVKEEKIDATAIAMADFLNNNTMYIAVHKRSYEGACNQVMSSDSTISLERPFPGNYSKFSNFSAYSQTHPNTELTNPLCNMYGDFIENVCDEAFSTSSCPFMVLYAWDGEGNFSESNMYHDSILSRNVTSKAFYEMELLEGDWMTGILENQNYIVDMLLAMNAELFIMSPYSSFSWNIVEMRDIMHKVSYPRFTRPPNQAVLNIWMYGSIDEDDILAEWSRFKRKFYINDKSFYNSTGEGQNIGKTILQTVNTTMSNFSSPRTFTVNGKNQSTIGMNQSGIDTNHHNASNMTTSQASARTNDQNISGYKAHKDEYSPNPNYTSDYHDSSQDILGFHSLEKYFSDHMRMNENIVYCVYALISYNLCLIIWCYYQYGGCLYAFADKNVQQQPYLPLQTFDNEECEVFAMETSKS